MKSEKSLTKSTQEIVKNSFEQIVNILMVKLSNKFLDDLNDISEANKKLQELRNRK